MAVRITIKRTKSENADKLYVEIDDRIVDFENGDEKVKYYEPGLYRLTAFLVRLNGSTGKATGSVTVTQGTTVLVDAMPLQTTKTGEMARSHTTFTVVA
jgi:hypothetical protein